MHLLLRSLAACVLLAGFVMPAAAQNRPDSDVPRVTRTYAIENARIVQAPGRVIERGTVVVRDGRILAVGQNVRVPFDAARIAGDSLTVYAGFIDALSHAGIPAPQREGVQGRGPGQPGAFNQPRLPDPDNPPDDRAGRQPDRRATTLLKADDAAIGALRKAGFTLAHTVPRDGFLPGQGALVFLGDRADARDLVLRDGVSLYATWQGARGAYPSTPMAIMAAWRDLYHEAQRRGQMASDYARGPAGRERAPFNPVYDAFLPVAAGALPVFFYGDDALQAHRALQLSKELGFKVVLAGMAQAHEMPERLQQSRVPLVLTLGLPEPPRGSAPNRDSAHVVTPGTSTFLSDLRTISYRDVEQEQQNLTARGAGVQARYEGTAAMLDSLGLPFAFATAEAKPSDIHKNLRKMIERGLSEDAALAALTTRAAEILGITRDFGTVEAGKIANLVVTDGPYFDEKTQVRMVFVDGDRFDYEARPAARRPGRGGSGAAPAESVSAVGAWSLSMPSPDGGSMGGMLTITGTPGALGGTLAVEIMPQAATLEGVTLDGNTLSFSFNAGQFGRINATATVNGDRLDGTIDVPGFGAMPFNATRIPGR